MHNNWSPRKNAVHLIPADLYVLKIRLSRLEKELLISSSGKNCPDNPHSKSRDPSLSERFKIHSRPEYSQEESCTGWKHRFDLLIQGTTLLPTRLPIPVLTNITIEPWNSQLETVRGIPWTLKPRNCIAASELHRERNARAAPRRSLWEEAAIIGILFPRSLFLHKISLVNKLARPRRFVCPCPYD